MDVVWFVAVGRKYCTKEILYKGIRCDGRCYMHACSVDSMCERRYIVLRDLYVCMHVCSVVGGAAVTTKHKIKL